MPCLFAMFAGLFPRIADLLLWIARPAMFSTAFKGSWFWPMLGIIFLPLTTLFYVFMYTPGIGLRGWDWLWIALAVVLDIGHLGHTTWTNRQAIPGVSSTPSTPGATSTPSSTSTL
jgi:hypothetical protein